MPKLPQISGSKLIKLLKKEDWVEVSQKGSHVKLRKESGSAVSTVIIPNHKIIKKGTLSGILKQTKIKI